MIFDTVSMLLLASVRAYGKNGAPDRLREAKLYWRKKKERATTNELINQLRRELWSQALNPEHFSNFTAAGTQMRNPKNARSHWRLPHS